MSHSEEKQLNVQLFRAITVYHFMSLLFFISDFFYIRIPLSGLITSWCASIEPSGYLIIIPIISYYINYAVMLMPFLVSVIRIVLIIFPQNHKTVTKNNF
uniref:Acyl_transf_3 domain-containing protein n=1 Tax=Caenorhabditis tropicalis TaxID=1561998 RepID=A0A1I7TY90_9PELO